jgi:hypothetical protein
MHFCDAVAWRLAAEVSLPLKVKADLAQLAFSMARQRLDEAVAVEQRGRESGPPPESDFIRSRG